MPNCPCLFCISQVLGFLKKGDKLKFPWGDDLTGMLDILNFVNSQDG